MDKKRLEIIVTAVLAVVLIFILSGALKKWVPKYPATANLRIPEEKVNVSAKTTPTFNAKKEGETNAEEYDYRRLRDPFSPPEVSEGPVSAISKLRITGITRDGKGKVIAIINEKIVNVGGKVGNFTVLDITANKAIVTDGKQNFELKLEQ